MQQQRNDLSQALPDGARLMFFEYLIPKLGDVTVDDRPGDDAVVDELEKVFVLQVLGGRLEIDFGLAQRAQGKAEPLQVLIVGG